jgi:hypothetical protein
MGSEYSAQLTEDGVDPSPGRGVPDVGGAAHDDGHLGADLGGAGVADGGVGVPAGGDGRGDGERPEQEQDGGLPASGPHGS